MKARCHACGREYLVARMKAGVAVRCRGCGAANDGAGGPPPAVPPEPSPPATRPAATGRGSRRGTDETLSDGGFVVGGAPPLPARRPPAVAEGPERGARRGGGAALRWTAGLVIVAAVVATAIFAWSMLRRGSVADARKAVAQITVADGTVANGFLAELDGRLWFVTQFVAIEHLDRIDASFRDLESGAVLVDLLGLPVERFICHPRFFETSSFDDWQRRYETVAIDVTDHRERLARAGIRALRVAGLEVVAAGDRLVRYAHEVNPDLGERGREGDEAIEGIAIHAVRAGDVVRIRREDGLPTTIETTIDSRIGTLGAPLLDGPGGSVVAISYLPVRDEDGTEFRPNASMATDAAVLADLVSRGHPLAKVRTELAAAAKRGGWRPGTSRKGGEIEKTWPTFREVDLALAALSVDGWSFSTSFVVDCGADAAVRLPVRSMGSGGGASNVLLVAFPEERLVDLDIGEVEFMGLRGIGLDTDSIPGVLAAVALSDPTTGHLLVAPAGSEFIVPLEAYFAGRTIDARCSLVLLERVPRPGGVSAGSGSQASGASPAPVAPAPSASPPPPAPSGASGSSPGSQSPPAAPAPQPSVPTPAAPPSTPPSGGATPGSRAGIAAMAEAQSLMIDDLFASSLVGMREFDRRFMTYPLESGGLDALRKDFVDGAVVLGGVDPDLIRDIMEVSLGAPLLYTRPVAEIMVDGAPDGTALAVYLEIDPAWRHLVSLPGNGLVTSRTDIRVGRGIAPPDGVFDAGSGRTQIALDIPWNVDGLRALTTAAEVPYALRVVYDDGSEDRIAARWRINPMPEVERGYPFELAFASLVDETHPWVKRLIEEIQNDPKVRAARLVLAGAGGNQQQQLESLALVWRELMLRGLRYQSLTGAAVGAQRCRLVHESLGGAAANCVDGAVLFASIAQAMGIDSHLVFVPGHALLACALPDPQGTRFLFIETTKLGDSVRSNPATSYDDLFEPMRRAHAFLDSSEVNCFESACEEGWNAYRHFIEEARRVYVQNYARYRRTLADQGPLAPDTEALRAQLSAQARIVPIGDARRASVRPVGVPTDLDARFKMAPRLRN